MARRSALARSHLALPVGLGGLGSLGKLPLAGREERAAHLDLDREHLFTVNRAARARRAVARVARRRERLVIRFEPRNDTRLPPQLAARVERLRGVMLVVALLPIAACRLVAEHRMPLRGAAAGRRIARRVVRVGDIERRMERRAFGRAPAGLARALCAEHAVDRHREAVRHARASAHALAVAVAAGALQRRHRGRSRHARVFSMTLLGGLHGALRPIQQVSASRYGVRRRVCRLQR